MSILMTGVGLTKRGLLLTISFYFTFFTWYIIFSGYILRHALGSSVEIYPMVNSSFNFIIVISLILSSFLMHRFNKIHTISTSFLAISIVSISLLFTSSIVLRLMIIFVAGAFFGIGLLASFTYFWGLTVSEERGRVAGLAGFISLLLAQVVILMAETFNFSELVMLGAIISLGPTVTKLIMPEKKEMLTTKKSEKRCYPEKRTILLYTIPWALFSLINATLARNISFYILQQVPSSFYMLLLVLQMTASFFGALGGGIIADFFGRRLSLVVGLTLYGIGSALVGLVESYEIFYFSYLVNGLSWGIFLAVYLLVVWGDLANEESCSKRYSIGLIIYYLSTGVGILLTNQISQIPLIISSLASCALVFFANIPLILAPELGSSDFRERIKLKLHMDVVKKIERKQSQNQG